MKLQFRNGGKFAGMAKRSNRAGQRSRQLAETAVPMLGSKDYQNITRAAEHPVVAGVSYYREVFRKLLEGQRTLGEDEVQVLRHVAQHPDLVDRVDRVISRSLKAAADLHDAARASAENAGRRPLTSSEIKRDIARVIGSPQASHRSRR